MVAIRGERSSLSGRHRAVRVRSRRPLPIVDLVTGALVLVAATAALAGPVTAAMLMRRHGAVLGGTAPAWSLGLGVMATVLASGSAAAMLAVAWRRSRSGAGARQSVAVRVASDARPDGAGGYPMRGQEIADRGRR